MVRIWSVWLPKYFLLGLAIFWGLLLDLAWPELGSCLFLCGIMAAQRMLGILKFG